MATPAQDLEDLKNLEKELAMLRQVNAAELDRMNQSISSQIAGAARLLEQEQQLGQERQNLEAMAKRLKRIRDEEVATGRALSVEDERRVAAQEAFVAQAQKELDVRKEQLTFLHSQLDVTKAIAGSLTNVYQAGKLALVGVFAAIPAMLLESDSLLREMAKNTGMGAMNMGRLRDSIIESGVAARRLGATSKELVVAQSAYVEATGRLNLLSGESLRQVTAIAEGTHLGYEGAAKLAGEFAAIGYSVADTKKWAEGVVNDTEAMGLNSGKVLKNITTMVDKAKSYSFQDGMGKGLTQMAQQAEKMKISIAGAFAAADKARTLEGSLAMASQLMVLGGNFAKADPFQLSFLSRNDPAKFQAALGDMTKGMATFNSQTGQLEISAYNMDRLRAAAEATGAPLNDLIDASRKAAEIGKMSQQLFVGTQQQRDTIMTLATLGKNGKATISIEGKDVDLNKLTQAQANLLMTERASLEERSKQAMGFDKQWGIFAEELKAVALPLLETVNKGMTMFNKALDFVGPEGMKWVFGLTAGAFALTKAFSLAQTLKYLGTGQSSASGGGFLNSLASRLRSNGTGGGPPVAPVAAPSTGSSPLGGGGKGLTSFTAAATLAAVGVAAVGIGYGFKLAAEGAATFAKSLEKLNPQQLEAMQGGLTRLGLGIGGIVLVAAGLAASGVGEAAIITLLGVGAAVTTIGFGVKLATDGMGNMMTSIGALASVDLGKLGGFFSTVTGFMDGDTANLDKLVETVNGLGQTSQDTFIERLEELWKTPLTIAASDVSFTANIEVNNHIGDEKFVNHFAKKFAAKIQQAAKGGGSL